MSGPFHGRWEVAVHNNRVIIPAQFKKRFGEESLRTVVITSGPRNSIALYPLDTWTARLAELAAGSEQDRKKRSRLIDCAIIEAELEGPGRIRIPEEQLQEAGITNKVIVKGDVTFISVWNPESYFEKYRQAREESQRDYDTEDFH